MTQTFFTILCLLLLLAGGCSTNTHFVDQTRQVKNGDFILSTTNALPDSVYELRVYVVAMGDSASKIAGRFQISLSDIEALNPGIQLNRLLVGQRIRVYEQKQE